MSNANVYRGLSAEFLDRLDHLVDDPDGAWWRDVLRRRDLVIAIRREALNVYFRGASLFQVDSRRGVLTPSTHAKYLSRQRQGPVPLARGRFGIEPTQAVWSRYAPDTLVEMMGAAARLAGPEKTGLHGLLIASPRVIDVEIALEGTGNDTDEPAIDGAKAAAEVDAAGPPVTSHASRARRDRLDVATVESDADGPRIAFHEAKHFTNPELRAGSARYPKVATQIDRYRGTIARHADNLARSYREVCRALVRIDTMRRRLDPTFPVVDGLIRQVAESPSHPRIDPEPRLVIFGFDCDQRDGAVWKQHHQRLTQARPEGLGLHVSAFGATAGRRAPAFT